MKTSALTEIARAADLLRDAGRHAARVVMVSILLLFAFMVLLQALTS